MRTARFASLNPFPALPDEQAMWRVQTADDERAFTLLVRRWEEPIRRLCIRMLGDAHRGEDLAQETFVRIFARRKDYQPSGQFSTWLWRIALNLCYDELRRRRRRNESSLDGESDTDGPALLDAVLSEEPGPDHTLDRQEQGEMVRRALLRLPEIYRAVIVMRHYEDLKFREIADVLEIPEGTVKSRMAEGMTQLSRLLRPAVNEEARGGVRPTPPPQVSLML